MDDNLTNCQVKPRILSEIVRFMIVFVRNSFSLNIFVVIKSCFLNLLMNIENKHEMAAIRILYIVGVFFVVFIDIF